MTDRAAIRAEALEEAAIAARNALCDMEWPPADGDRQIDVVMASIRALRDRGFQLDGGRNEGVG